MNAINCDGKEIKTIDVFLRVFLSLETFLQKATTLNIFESLFFNYKIKVSSVDQRSSQFTSFVVELCNDLELTLQERTADVRETGETTPQTAQISYQEFENVGDNLEYTIPLPVEPEFSNIDTSEINDCQNEGCKSSNDESSEETPTSFDESNKSVNTCDLCNRTYMSNGKSTKHVCKSTPPSDSQDEELVDDPDFNVTEESSIGQMSCSPESDPQVPVYVCAFCFSTYSQRDQFDQHNHGTNSQEVVLLTDVEQLKSQRKFSCGVCHEVYRSLGRISFHVARCRAGPYHCELCTHIAPSKQLLNRHKKKQHKGVESFFCSECGLGFKLRTSLQKHQVNRHESEQDHFICNLDNCGQIFTKKIQLTNHKIEAHGFERKFLCQVCGHKFMTQESLSSHLESHSNKRKFECQFCGKVFGAKEKMIFHVRTHTGEKPFVCDRPQCSKSFISKAKLKEHLSRHAGEKRHKCSECGKQYANKIDLKIHIRKIHIRDDSMQEAPNVQTPTPAVVPLLPLEGCEGPVMDQTQPSDLYSQLIPGPNPGQLFNNVQFYPEPVQLVRTISVPQSVVIASYDTLIGI